MQQLPTAASAPPTPESGPLARAVVEAIAAKCGLRLVTPREASGLGQLVTETTLMWHEQLVIVPTGQDPAETLAQLREALKAQADEIQRARDFEASVAAGHVEDVEAWGARVSKGGAA